MRELTRKSRDGNILLRTLDTFIENTEDQINNVYLQKFTEIFGIDMNSNKQWVLSNLNDEDDVDFYKFCQRVNLSGKWVQEQSFIPGSMTFFIFYITVYT
jgi:hypothetical protein